MPAPDVRALVVVLAIATAFDVAFRTRVDGLAGFLLVVVAAAGLVCSAVVASGVVVVLVLNMIDPEAHVVSHNADRYAAGALSGKAAEFDVNYTETLSDDAVPALAAVLPKLDAQHQRPVLDRICQRDNRRSSRGTNVAEQRPALGWNHSAAEAKRVREELCR